MNIRPYVLGLSAVLLLSLAGAASAHGVRHGYGYGYSDAYGYPVARWQARRYCKSRNYRQRVRHFNRHYRRSRYAHYVYGDDLRFDGFGQRRSRY